MVDDWSIKVCARACKLKEKLASRGAILLQASVHESKDSQCTPDYSVLGASP